MRHTNYLERNARETLFEAARRGLRLFGAILKGRKALTIWFLYNMPSSVRAVFWRRFGLDRCLDPSYGSQNNFEPYLTELKSKGISKLPALDTEILERLDKAWKKDFSSNSSVSLPIESDLVDTIFRRSGLKHIVTAYYGREAFFRESPTLNVLVKSDPGLMQKPSRVFHADGFRQVSVMILLNDLSDDSIHMEYCLGSHSEQQASYDRRRLVQENIRKNYDTMKLVGPRGTVYIFDTEGFHRGNYVLDIGSPSDFRYMLHANFHPGIYQRIR